LYGSGIKKQSICPWVASRAEGWGLLVGHVLKLFAGERDTLVEGLEFRVWSVGFRVHPSRFQISECMI